MVEPIEITLGDGSVAACDSLKEAFQKLKAMNESRRIVQLSEFVKPSAEVDRARNRVR
jgi:hypothetical protein